MILIVDAFNLIYKFPDLEEEMYAGRLDKARIGLLQYLIDYKNAWKKPVEIHVFIDGKKKHGDETRRETNSKMEIYYSQDLSADHLIKEFIKRNPNPGNLTLISSDKDIQFYAKRFKTTILTSEEFSKHLIDILNSADKKPSQTEKPAADPDEVSYWMKMFQKKK